MAGRDYALRFPGLFIKIPPNSCLDLIGLLCIVICTLTRLVVIWSLVAFENEIGDVERNGIVDPW